MSILCLKLMKIKIDTFWEKLNLKKKLMYVLRPWEFDIRICFHMKGNE